MSKEMAMQHEKSQIKYLVVSILIMFFIPACVKPTKNATEIEPFNPVKIMADAYSEVTVEDKIDHLEATVLADAYFISYISGYGVVGVVIDQGDKWEAKTVIGVAAAPLESIFIQKATGIITCKKGPVVTPLSSKLNINK